MPLFIGENNTAINAFEKLTVGRNYCIFEELNQRWYYHFEERESIAH